jgi:hypothetical protein
LQIFGQYEPDYPQVWHPNGNDNGEGVNGFGIFSDVLEMDQMEKFRSWDEQNKCMGARIHAQARPLAYSKRRSLLGI